MRDAGSGMPEQMKDKRGDGGCGMPAQMEDKGDDGGRGKQGLGCQYRQRMEGAGFRRGCRTGTQGAVGRRV